MGASDISRKTQKKGSGSKFSNNLTEHSTEKYTNRELNKRENPCGTYFEKAPIKRSETDSKRQSHMLAISTDNCWFSTGVLATGTEAKLNDFKVIDGYGKQR